MNKNRFLLVCVIPVIIAAAAFWDTAAAGLPLDPWPDCGIYTIDNVVPGTYGGNLDVVGLYLLPTSFYAYDLTSYNGWEIIEVYFWLSSIPNIFYVYPPGTTEVLIEVPFITLSTSVSLEKKCSAPPQCVPTGRYVYTLFGNYVCNLVTEEAEIPDRFLDPEYTAPLCQLPKLEHNWNGDWVRNRELDCGGYLTAGNHYDTSLPVLP